MGSVGDCYDIALAESFFASLESELIDRTTFKTQTDAELAVFGDIEGLYNPKRRHSSLGQVSPANFEDRHQLSVATMPSSRSRPVAESRSTTSNVIATGDQMTLTEVELEESRALSQGPRLRAWTSVVSGLVLGALAGVVVGIAIGVSLSVALGLL